MQIAKRWTSKEVTPILIYRESSPQHFKGSAAAGGTFSAAANMTACAASIPAHMDPLSTPERGKLAGRVPVLAVNPLSASVGTRSHLTDGNKKHMELRSM